MSYMHIDNLYKVQSMIFQFREVWAMEKIHGTSAHIRWADNQVYFSPGGLKQEQFVALFDAVALEAAFRKLGYDKVTVFGEGYGGKCQAMSHTYGKETRFVGFEVKVGESWLSVPNAADVCSQLGLDFVPYRKVEVTVEALNAERDRPSEQAKKNGILEDKLREGIVIRPLMEMHLNDGSRVIAKHKGEKFSETRTPRPLDVDKQKVLDDANAIAFEWVTDERMRHVLDKLGNPKDMTRTGDVIKAMVEDVTREASGEIADNKDIRKAIGAAAAKIYKKLVTTME